MAYFPANLEELTPELLTTVLAESRAGVVVEDVRVGATAQWEHGSASTADRVVLDLRYAAGCHAGLPSRMLIKTFLVAPHAPRVMYRTEVRFYRDIRPQLTFELPQVFASVVDEETGQFGLLMEDLGLRGARFPNATTPVSLAELTSLLEALAELHATFWQSPRFERDLSWLATPCSGGMHKIFRNFGFDLVSAQLEHEFKATLVRPLNRSLEELWVDLWRAQEILASEPTTLLHGDTHIGNTYLLPDGRGGLIDWQLMIRGQWAHDVTYLLVTALEPAVRRQHQRELIAMYLSGLRRRGVTAPSEDAAWLRYRQAAIWGLVIGWLITPPENYGPEITAANLSRLVTAVQDLETFQALA